MRKFEEPTMEVHNIFVEDVATGGDSQDSSFTGPMLP